MAEIGKMVESDPIDLAKLINSENETHTNPNQVRPSNDLGPLNALGTFPNVISPTNSTSVSLDPIALGPTAHADVIVST